MHLLEVQACTLLGIRVGHTTVEDMLEDTVVSHIHLKAGLHNIMAAVCLLLFLEVLQVVTELVLLTIPNLISMEVLLLVEVSIIGVNSTAGSNSNN